MATIKEIKELLQSGKTINHNGKQMSYSEPHRAYVIDGVRTISIIHALKMMG